MSIKPLRSVLDRFKLKKKESVHLEHHLNSGPLDSGLPDPDPDPKILALRSFQTITLMLSLVQSRKRFTSTVYFESDHALRKELKLLDALAAIAIREHGIAAVIGRRHDESGTYQILATGSSDSSPDPYIPQPQPQPAIPPLLSMLGLGGLYFIFTWNGRENTGIELLTTVKIIDPCTTVPKELQDVNEADLLDTYLMHVPKRDQVLHKSFLIHIWMIGKLLDQTIMISGSRYFLLYIVASCYQKMLIRMNYRTSQSIRITLKNMTMFSFSDQVHDATLAEQANNTGFLATLLDFQPVLTLTADVPRLTHWAKTMPFNWDFYTEETCIEFHLLLSELLENFHGALKGLDTIRNDKPNAKKLINQLELVGRLGLLLRLMIKGAAIKKHFKVIEKLLPDRPPYGEHAEGDRKAKDDEGDEGDEVDDKDGGAEAPYQARLQSKWQIWSERLELLVIHFDSTQILEAFIKSYGGKLKTDMKVLSEPLPDTSLLNWKDLLKEICTSRHVAEQLITFLDLNVTTADPEIGPEVDSPKAYPEVGYPEADPEINYPEAYPKVDYPETDLEVIPKVIPKSITRPLTSEEICKLVKDLGRTPQLDENVEAFTRASEHIILKLKTVTNCTSPLSSDFIPAIIKRLGRFKDMWVYTTQEDMIKELSKIDLMLRTLRDNAKLFLALRETEPLCTGKGLKTACHCEVSLGAHCLDNPTWRINGKRPIGVSKRCYPVCAYLLSLMTNFTYTHSHNTITPCSLPESLPLETIKLMVAVFGKQLITDLVELKERTEMLSSIDPSISSVKLSVDSHCEPTNPLKP